MDEKLKKLKIFEFNPLKVNRFIITLPEGLEISEFYIKKFKVDNNIINIDIIETVEKNIRDTFMDISNINEKIKESDSIMIEYLDPYGNVVRREIYEGISYIGEGYESWGDYEDIVNSLTTTLKFLYKERRNATAS